jgi:hypothetical protein
VIGDVDGDLSPEVVVANKRNEVRVYAGDGALENVHSYLGTVPYVTAPALGDLDSDGVPEIVVQTDDWLNVLEGDGSPFPGWPVALGSSWWIGNSAPVIGDVDGDEEQDIVITLQVAGSAETGQLRAYDRNGSLLAGFPLTLPIGSGAVPAIADLDRDGRNEILVSGSYWNGVPGSYAKCWAFDLHGLSYGGIEWGQFMHDAGHTGVYGPPSGVAVEDVGTSRQSTRLMVIPNPARAGERLVISGGVAAESGATVEIFDVHGRLLRRLGGPSAAVWNGRDEVGRALPPGAYFLHSQRLRTKLVLLP